MKLDEKAFALAAGIVGAVHSLLGFGLMGAGTGMMGLGGYGVMMGGGFFGIVIHFLTGLIAGYAFAWLYNTLHRG